MAWQIGIYKEVGNSSELIYVIGTCKFAENLDDWITQAAKKLVHNNYFIKVVEVKEK